MVSLKVALMVSLTVVLKEIEMVGKWVEKLVEYLENLKVEKMVVK